MIDKLDMRLVAMVQVDLQPLQDARSLVPVRSMCAGVLLCTK